MHPSKFNKEKRNRAKKKKLFDYQCFPETDRGTFFKIENLVKIIKLDDFRSMVEITLYSI